MDFFLFYLHSLVFQLPLHNCTWWSICLCIAIALVWLRCCRLVVVWLGVHNRILHCKHPFLNHFVLFSVSTGPCHRPRASSVDLLIESSFSIGTSISPPSKICRNKETAQLEEASYLVIGEGDGTKEDEYVNYQVENSGVNKSKITIVGTGKNCLVSPSMTSQKRLEKPETSSNCTTFTAPSASSSSSSAVHSVTPLSLVSMDCDLKGHSSLHDSTVSRLIDAVSLGNDQETCGSISALIGQFESTFERNTSTALSSEHTPSCHSNLRPATPKVVQDLRSPLKTDNLKEKSSISNGSHKIMSACKTGETIPPLLSSPETTEHEEVYTILDEEVLLPVSVYNLKKQSVHAQVDNAERTFSNSLGSSPGKAAQDRESGCNMGWDDMYRMRAGSEEAEERIYEEVHDPPVTVLEREWGTSKTSTSSFVNDKCPQFHHDSVSESFREVEINVDEDPLDMMLTSSGHDRQWEGLTSPTKRQAIYENHESTPNHFQHKPSSSYLDLQHYPTRVYQVAYSQCPSPINKPSCQLSSPQQRETHPQPSQLHKHINSRSSNPSPLCQNSYPIPQSNSKVFNSSSSYAPQRSYGGSQHLHRSYQDRLGFKHEEREQARGFDNGFSSSESVPRQSAGPINSCKDRRLYWPSSTCNAAISRVDCVTPSLESPALQRSQAYKQNETQLYTRTQDSVNNTKQTEASNLGPLSTCSQSSSKDSIVPTPCKSKSLGDLTSEDISCNFQGKYHIISRSFITPHMRKQKRMGTMGEVTFQSHSCDPLTQQLRKLVSLEGDDSDRDRPGSPQQQATTVAPVVPRNTDDSPPPLTRRLSSRSQSRVRHINSRARERQQEGLKPRAGVVLNSPVSVGGVVLRNKPSSQNPPANRHSTGSYIAGYLGQLEDRGLPEGSCTSLRYGNGDHYGDRYYTDDSVPPRDSYSVSEPEVYFLLRL